MRIFDPGYSITGPIFTRLEMERVCRAVAAADSPRTKAGVRQVLRVPAVQALAGHPDLLALAAEFNLQIDSATLDEFIVKIYGDTAVVWMSQHLVGPSKGSQLRVTFHYVDVFVMRAGRWQCVASQSTRVSAG